ncbi:hypothetical protein [Streptomyces asiaticus]
MRRSSPVVGPVNRRAPSAPPNSSPRLVLRWSGSMSVTFLTDRLSKRGEITGFRTSVIFQQVSNTAPARLG